MAVLHRSLRSSTSKSLKVSSYYIIKPFSSLHAHGQRPDDSQPLFTPWLAQSLNPQQHGILDLLKKSERPPHFVPGAEISRNRGAPESFRQLLEECGIRSHLEEKRTNRERFDPEILEDSRSNDEEERLKIWADSVKKKRRKKMNKHKYKKLRKRLRRKKKK